MAAAAPVLPVGYVISASRIADRRMILVGYRLADLLTRFWQLGKKRSRLAEIAVQKQKESDILPVFPGEKNFDCAQLLR
jgi:hypothetical protein